MVLEAKQGGLSHYSAKSQKTQRTSYIKVYSKQELHAWNGMGKTKTSNMAFFNTQDSISSMMKVMNDLKISHTSVNNQFFKN